MKKIILVIVTVLFITFSANARNGFIGIAQKGGKVVRTSTTVSYKLMESYPSCTITVYLTGTLTIASIFSDNFGSVKANPFTANSDASFFFYADDGRYDIKFSGTGIAVPFTWADVSLKDITSSSPPSGAASGDLSGSYPSPTVSQARGLRETSGPTTLTLGAIADGQFLRRSGSTVIGSTLFGMLNIYNAKTDCGMLGNNSTDDTTAFQACINAIDSAGLDATIYFPPGRYIIGGALQDTSNSNSQIVLPKRATQLSLRFLGSTPPSLEPFTTNTQGAVIKSTLASGDGAVFGVKGGFNIPIVGETNLQVTFENITVQTIPNPTISALDLRYVPNSTLRNVVISTSLTFDESGDHVEPTTTTSYGLKTGLNNIGDAYYLDNVLIFGFYNNALFSELVIATNLISVYSVWPVTFNPGFYRNIFDRILVTSSKHGLRFVDLDAPHNSYVEVEDFSIEHDSSPAWAVSIDDISDLSNIAVGFINFHGTTSGVGVLGNITLAGGENLKPGLQSADRPYNSRGIFTEISSGFGGLDTAIWEINRSSTTSNNTKYATLNLVAAQTGTTNLIGTISFVNSSIVAAEKRLGVLACSTNGATNTGKCIIAINNAGTIADKFAFDNLGRLGVGTISPTSSLQVIGLPIFANNAAALAGGLTVGAFYRTGADPDPVMVVH